MTGICIDYLLFLLPFRSVKMSFWSENYSFIKEVYDTRVNKMVEWMDQVEIAITKVMATKVYTSAEFKRERDNFLSLIKNLEKSDTKKWLDEVKETLFKDRAGDERKEEHQRLEAVIERHQTLIPRVHETQVKSEVYLSSRSYLTGVLKPKPNFLNCSTGLSTDS